LVITKYSFSTFLMVAGKNIYQAL